MRHSPNSKTGDVTAENRTGQGHRKISGILQILLGSALATLLFHSHLTAQDGMPIRSSEFVDPRPSIPSPPPRVARMNKVELVELEEVDSWEEPESLPGRLPQPNPPLVNGPLIQQIQDNVRKLLTGGNGGSFQADPTPWRGQPLQPAQTQSLPFADLPRLDSPESSTDGAKQSAANPGIGARSSRFSTQRVQQDEDIAPRTDPPIHPIEVPSAGDQSLRDQKVEVLPQSNESAIPLDAPPVETFDGQENPDLYRGSQPDSKTVYPLWWDELVVNKQGNTKNHWNVGINDMIAYFLKNSPRLKSIRLLRESAQPAIPESIAEFDPTVFVESNFVRLNDPIGNTLTTGGSGRFLDNNWTTRGGLRKKFRTGGSLEAFQRFGIQTNNSEFFVPDQQGTAYLSLNFTQPLLNGRGKLYNEGLIAIASLENSLAGDMAEQKIQTELLDLVKSYWQLYSYRAIWFQKQKNVQRAESIYNELRGRKDFDVSQTQLLRAKAAVETRKAELIQALNDVRDTEARLSALLGIDIKFQRFEYVPNFVPNLYFPSIEVGDAFVTAISNRPEILQAAKQAEIAATRANRSRHELLPVLDFLVGTYVSGLDSNYEFIDAFGRQFSDGAPGYSAGLNFEVPLHRRAAKARLDRDEIRWQAITSELESKMLEVQSEVDIAVREVENSYRKLVARSVAMESARQEMLAQRERLNLSLNDGDNIGNTLNFLLDAQDRLAQQENLLAQAQGDYMVSWVALKKAMGTLVLVEDGK